MAIDINIPSQVKTFANLAGFPVTGVVKTIYIAEDTNKTYRWTGSVYVEISASTGGAITIGTTAIASGTVGRVLFEGTGNVVQESANLSWNNTNGWLGIGTVSPLGVLHLKQTASTTRMLMDGDAGQSKIITFRTNGLQRFGLYLNNIAESGGNAGSNFAIRAYNDAGLLLSTPLYIHRDSGNIGVNTTVDSGFKFDVNGTARITGLTTIANDSNLNFVSATNPNAFVGIGFLSSGATERATFKINWGSGEIRIGNTTGGGYFPTFYANAAERMRILGNGNILINTTTDIASSKLTIESTTQGFLPPRMTTTQKNAIATPAAGLVVYDTTLNKLCVRTASAWETITSL